MVVRILALEYDNSVYQMNKRRLLSGMNMTDNLPHDNRIHNQRSPIRVGIYGVSCIEDGEGCNNPLIERYEKIYYCGMTVGGWEQRASTNRIWYIPKESILESGEVEGYAYRERPVKWFDVYVDTPLMEENYTSVSLDNEIERASKSFAVSSGTCKTFAAQLGIAPSLSADSTTATPPQVFASRIGIPYHELEEAGFRIF